MAFLLTLLCATIALSLAEDQERCTAPYHVNFVLVGATGNLAKKYIWQALFIQAVENDASSQLHVWAAATRPFEEGTALIKPILKDLRCELSWDTETCQTGKY